MRLIDVDAFKADYRMADECKDCTTPVRACEYDRVYTKMDFCSWLDDAPTIVPSAQSQDIVRDIATIIENEKDMRVILDHQWIPCSERLPDDSATVLITHRGGVSFGWYNGRYWERGANAKHRPLQTVIAWMPLPEPYKEGQG